jgi:hypothetical protein
MINPDNEIKRIEALLTDATKSAYNLVEQLAKEAINNSVLDGFTMAMGSACFWYKGKSISWDDNIISEWEIIGDEEIETQIDISDIIKPTFDLIHEFNDRLYLTGWPLKINIDNVSKELISITDW